MSCGARAAWPLQTARHEESCLDIHHLALCVYTGWSAAAYALVGRADLAEMAAAATEAEAASKQASVQAVRAGPSMALEAGVLEAARLGNPGDGAKRRPQLSPLWQPKLRTPAPGAQLLWGLLEKQLLFCRVQEALAITSWAATDNQVSSLLPKSISRALRQQH